MIFVSTNTLLAVSISHEMNLSLVTKTGVRLCTDVLETTVIQNSSKWLLCSKVNNNMLMDEIAMMVTRLTKGKQFET